VDVVADEAARSVLSRAAVGVLSEESGLTPSAGSLVVVVDPIDGSTNCSRGVGFFGPSLCAVDAEGPLAAVVHNVGTGRRYAAVRDRGATVNGTAMRPSADDRVGVIAIGDPCRVLERLPAPGTLPISVRVSGSSAHDLCLVAEGVFDAYVDCGNTQSVWDYLGASLVLRECGGIVAERDGEDLLDMAANAKRRLVAATSPEQFIRLTTMLLGDHRCP
jgi:myo-inositol-1(or 4)-monophosphatase